MTIARESRDLPAPREGVLATTALGFTSWAERWFPDAYIFAALAVILLAAYISVNIAGAKPFPAAPDSNLPTVLKALHLQRVFTRFAIDNQMHAAGNDEPSARQLYDNFQAFVAANKPGDLGAPTQAPGVIGI